MEIISSFVRVCEHAFVPGKYHGDQCSICSKKHTRLPENAYKYPDPAYLFAGGGVNNRRCLVYDCSPIETLELARTKRTMPELKTKYNFELKTGMMLDWVLSDAQRCTLIIVLNTTGKRNTEFWNQIFQLDAAPQKMVWVFGIAPPQQFEYVYTKEGEVHYCPRACKPDLKNTYIVFEYPYEFYHDYVLQDGHRSLHEMLKGGKQARCNRLLEPVNTFFGYEMY